jgi:hypothetical protein
MSLRLLKLHVAGGHQHKLILIGSHLQSVAHPGYGMVSEHFGLEIMFCLFIDTIT